MTERAGSPERTDPWRWYCRLCGVTGEADTDASRDEAAYGHAAECGPEPGVIRFDGVGRLLHVWKTRVGLR